MRRKPLTEVQRTILWLISEGMTNKQIGKKIGRSPETVKEHVHQILMRLDVVDRKEAASVGISTGVI